MQLDKYFHLGIYVQNKIFVYKSYAAVETFAINIKNQLKLL